MQDSKIAWTDHTVNFWIGCSEVSPACDSCYARVMMDERYHRVKWNADRVRTAPATWKAPARWQRQAVTSGQRKRVFTLSLGDFFDNQVPPEWRVEAFDIIRRSSMLDWLILTKRPQNIRKMLPADWGDGWSHIAFGITVENMTEARRRIPVLLDIPVRTRFLSCEPMLESLDLTPWLPRLDWIIVGGESGAKPRMMEPAWAGRVRDDSIAASVPFFMKQMTALRPIPDDLLIRQFPVEPR